MQSIFTRHAVDGYNDMPDTKTSPATAATAPVDPAHLLPAKILLVAYRPGEAVEQHPELAAYLQDGWLLKSATPRIVEGKGARLLVVLAQSAAELPRAGTRKVQAA